MIGIYKITSPTGKTYIGQSVNIKKRFTGYKSLNGCKYQTRLLRSFIKHGVHNHIFEIVCECDISMLNEMERKWQDHYDVTNKYKGLNCVLTGTKTRSGRSSEETRAKISKGGKGIIKGPRSEETKMKLRIANLGKKATDEAKAKMSAVHKGNKYNLGKKHTQEFRDACSKRSKGNTYTRGRKLTKDHIYNAVNNRKDILLVLDTYTGIYYNNSKEAADVIGLDPSYFLKILKGKYRNRTGYILA